MIQQIKDLPENVLGFIYSGKVTGDDYENVVIPAFEKAVANKKKVQLVFKFNNDFDEMNFKAMMDDAYVGFKYFTDWEKIAIVSDHTNLNHIIKAFSFLMRGKMRIFHLAEYAAAVAWVAENN